jgi:hypothetical protein
MTHAVRETLDAALADRARRQKGIGDRKHDQVNALFATRRGTLSAYDVLPRPPSGRGPRRRSISSARARRGDRALVGTLALLVISILAMDSARGTQAWRTHNALFHQMIAVDSTSYRASGFSVSTRGRAATRMPRSAGWAMHLRCIRATGSSWSIILKRSCSMASHVKLSASDAQGETRTRKTRRSGDFESPASTNSTTWAHSNEM